MTRAPFAFALALVATVVALPAAAQAPACPAGNLLYWQAFPPGGESDTSARHQQVVDGIVQAIDLGPQPGQRGGAIVRFGRGDRGGPGHRCGCFGVSGIAEAGAAA